jgi:glucokinase
MGGSISKGYPFFYQALRKSMDDFAFPETLKRLKILPSQDENIALLGAAALAELQKCKV